MHVPEPVQSTVGEGSFAGISYRIRGELVPELQLELAERSVMHEHHTLLWKERAVEIELRKLSGAVKRKIAGLDFFVTRAKGPGRIAFSRDWPGQCIPLMLRKGEELHVREHHFLAASDDLDYSFERVQGVRNMLLGGSGLFIDRFRAGADEAIVWVHGQGNVFEVQLDAGEQLDVEAGGWLYKDASVKLESVSLGLGTGLFAGGGKLTFNRFTGPGRLAIQTMFIAPLEGSDTTQTAGAAASGGLAGAVLGGLLRN